MLEREALAVLVSTQGISYGQREMALRAALSAQAILEDPFAYAAQLGENGAAALRKMIRSGGIARTLDTLGAQGVKLVAPGDAGYSERLRQIPHPPHLLFCWGSEAMNDPLAVAVVGTRKATDYGLSHTRAISRELAQHGVCVVSGLALGVDAAAHRGALEGKGRTVAVLGGALDKLYPEANRGLMEEIIGSGGSVISEYPMGMRPGRYTFLHRNRIIAGMARGVLVTEGAKRSGALRTANDALDFGREVFALPGDVRSEGSQLPHMLIRDGALLVTCAGDILDALAIAPQEIKAEKADTPETKAKGRRKKAEPERESTPQGRPQPEGLGAQEAAVWQALSAGECDFDELCERTGIASQELGALLMMMELDGLVAALAGLRYRLA